MRETRLIWCFHFFDGWHTPQLGLHPWSFDLLMLYLLVEAQTGLEPAKTDVKDRRVYQFHHCALCHREAVRVAALGLHRRLWLGRLRAVLSMHRIPAERAGLEPAGP